MVRLRKELTDQGLDNGPLTIHWHLCNLIGAAKVPSPSTIHRILKARGLILDDQSKTPRPGWRRFEHDHANGLWQLDGTDWQLADGSPVKIMNLLDDGSRVLTASQAHRAESFDAAWGTVIAGFEGWGMPERVLHDNAKAFLSLGKRLGQIGIADTCSRAFHPQTCGKVERFHQTLKKWLSKQGPAQTPAGLQTQLDQFSLIYNYQRPHRGIGRQTPATRWKEMPKSGPGDRPLNTPTQIVTNKIRHQGWVTGHGYDFAVGTAHRGHPATIILTGSNCHIFTPDGLVRHLHIDPTRKTQPLHTRPGRPPTDQV